MVGHLLSVKPMLLLDIGGAGSPPLAAMVKAVDEPGFKALFAPQKQNADTFTFMSLFHHPESGYYVFTYFQPPR